MSAGPTMRAGLVVALLALALTTLVTVPARAVARPLLVMDLPVEGPLSAAAKAAYTVLRGSYGISWSQAQSGPKRYVDPQATVCTSDSQRSASAQIDRYVSQGGGLVVIVSARRVSRTNEFLKPLGAKLVSLAKATQQVTLLPHSATRNVGSLTVTPIRYGLEAKGLEPIAASNGSGIALAGLIGSARVVVLPEELLTVADPSQAPDAPQTRLLTQSIIWAAFGGTVAPGTGAGPGAADTGRPAAVSLSQKALVDVPEDSRWSAISAALRDGLATLGLPLQPVGYVKGQSDLVKPLQERPALLVLASYRDFEDVETAAVAQYVSAGGSLLVLGYGDKSTVTQVAGLNKLLGEFGVGYVLGRARGQVVLKPHPITQGLTSPGEIGPGGSVWAFADWPLAMVGDRAVASAAEFRQGRIIVFDASTLLPPTEKQPAAPQFFEGLLGSAMRWLTGK